MPSSSASDEFSASGVGGTLADEAAAPHGGGGGGGGIVGGSSVEDTARSGGESAICSPQTSKRHNLDFADSPAMVREPTPAQPAHC